MALSQGAQRQELRDELSDLIEQYENLNPSRVREHEMVTFVRSYLSEYQERRRRFTIVK